MGRHRHRLLIVDEPQTHNNLYLIEAREGVLSNRMCCHIVFVDNVAAHTGGTLLSAAREAEAA